MVDRLVRDENDGGVIRRDIDMGDTTFSERGVTHVNDGTSEFWIGHEFRSYLEFSTQNSNSIPVGQRILVRAVLAVNTVLTLAQSTLESGQIRIRSIVGGTPTGAFSVPMTSIRANAMSTTPAYASVNVFSATAPGLPAAVGIAGGTDSDVVRLKAASQNNQSQSVGAAAEPARGLPAATIYILLENVHATDVAEGMIKFRWSERP